MAVTNLLSKFRSITRPSLGKSTSSGTFSSYAKKQQAAEDAIMDNQYESGILSPEAYLSSLNTRLTRTSNTPLINVNLKEKIQNTQTKVNDAIVANNQASGAYTTGDVLSYEKRKLATMTETGSPTYLAQQQKITELQNKVEKEARTAYRTQEMLRISQLPGDNSATLWEKAKVLKTLSDQARLDGDTQQADTLVTQYNNTVGSAKRADVNDIITGARLSVSGTPTAGLGTPTSEAGASRLTSGGQVEGGGSTAGGGSSQSTAPSAVTTGYSGVSNTAVQNALKTLDAKYKSYERTSNAINDDNTMIAKYQEAIAASEGDQRTQLTIAYQNLVDSKAQKENSLGILEQGINDTATHIQELQQKAAASEFSQEVRKNNIKFDKAESDLETAFAKGEINKEEYVSKAAGLAKMKTTYLGQASDVFNQYGNDSSAQTYMDKSAEMEKVHQNLIGVANNINNWEPIAVDPGGKLTNIFGKSVQSGDVTLTNVQQLKDSGNFDLNYTNDNGVYRKITYPGVERTSGEYWSQKDLKDLGVVPVVYKTNKDGKQEQVTLVDTQSPGGKGAWAATSRFVTPDRIVADSKKIGDIQKQIDQGKSEYQAVLEKQKQDNAAKLKSALPIQSLISGNQEKQPSLIDRLFNPIQQKAQPAITNALTGVKDFMGNAISGAKDIFSQAKDKFLSASGNVGLPPLVKKAYATYSDTTDAQIRQWAEQAQAETGVSADLIIAQYKLESGNGTSAPGNNYFGMKGVGPAGSQRLLTTENRNGKNVKVYQNFRKYNSPEESFIDHARLLSKDPRYAGVLAASKTGDKNAIAEAIGNSPYATDSAYTDKIKKLMGVTSPTINQLDTNKPGNQYTPPVNSGVWSTSAMGGAGNTTATTSTRQTPQIKAQPANTPSFIPPVQRIEPNFSTPTYQQPVTRPNTSFINTVAKPAIQKVQAYVAPKIQAVQQYVAPKIQQASNFVSNAVNSAKNAISNWFKKK